MARLFDLPAELRLHNYSLALTPPGPRSFSILASGDHKGSYRRQVTIIQDLDPELRDDIEPLLLSGNGFWMPIKVWWCNPFHPRNSRPFAEWLGTMQEGNVKHVRHLCFTVAAVCLDVEYIPSRNTNRRFHTNIRIDLSRPATEEAVILDEPARCRHEAEMLRCFGEVVEKVQRVNGQPQVNEELLWTLFACCGVLDAGIRTPGADPPTIAIGVVPDMEMVQQMMDLKFRLAEG